MATEAQSQEILRRRLPNRWGLLRAHWRRSREQIKEVTRHPLGLIGTGLIVVFALMVLAHPVLMNTVWDRKRFDPIVGFDAPLAPHPTSPTSIHPLGTDGFGRDVLSQLLAGTRISFAVGLVAAVVAVTISTLMGGSAGYFGGTVDAILMGIADVFVLLPAPIVLMIFGLLVKMNWLTVGLLYGVLTGLGSQAIVVKSHTLSIKVKPFIEAARVAGGNNLHILRVHILPGLMPIMLVHAFFTVVGAVLTESLLSFFSRTTHYLSWGSMIWLGQETFRWFDLSGQWHAIAPPALAVMLFCSAFYLVGRALDDVFNPSLKKRR